MDEFYDDFDWELEEQQAGVNRPYNPDIEWGGSDKMSVTAMWMGDCAAEMYCFNKAQCLGGYPWDGAPTHWSYENGLPVQKFDFSSLDWKQGLMMVAFFLIAAIILCSATTW